MPSKGALTLDGNCMADLSATFRHARSAAQPVSVIVQVEAYQHPGNLEDNHR
jgi:hypothetical protein